MQIQYQALKAHLNQNLAAMYVLIGQDPYLLNEAAYQIKKTWKSRGETDETVINITSTSDWSKLIEESNSYSLFADHVLIDSRLDKKSIEQAGQKALKSYLQNTNPRCLIILRAPNVTSKQLQWLKSFNNTAIVQIYPFSPNAMVSWITQQLQNSAIQYQPQVPQLIHQFTQGNMLACAQVIEQVKLIYSEQALLTEEAIMALLSDQCHFSLFELADACLSADVNKSIHIIRQSSLNRTEPSLILWVLSQEIRVLINLSLKLKHNLNVNQACQDLKIWPKRIKLYQSALSRQTLSMLYQLLQLCKQIDEAIKSNQSHLIWQQLESVALGLCNTPIGEHQFA